MSNIKHCFANGKAFIGFLTGGDPSLEKSEEFILEMVRGGADLVEIGVPFSDPIAEGPVIQAANIRALDAGSSVDKLFQLVRKVRRQTTVPIVFLTYLNPVYHYGYEEFFKTCRLAEVDGIIIPDLPYEEQGEVRPSALANEIDLISLVAPTSEDRIKEIAINASGFLYVVSSLGVTGVRKEITTDLPSLLQAVKAVSDIPAAVGFGINTPEQAAYISRLADGIIVGSAIVKIIEKHGNKAGRYLYEYVKNMKEAL
ncbi:MAG: tryptophan synthase subunit alpha [Syntrophomonadaceae bacterium]|jgi:tryptophan synthase alpha chain|nr:tryptophan synthase subunit alpha [Syntrophomonadaceae bacterium]